jgi:YfiH family protein
MKVIRPSIFAHSSNITAAFTEANRSLQSGQPVQGLDFGINTPTEKAHRDLNFKKLLNFLGLESDSIALAEQVHGANIEIVEKPGIYENTDGLITKTPGLPLGIQVADCAAVLIADDVNNVIGAFHAGWRGAVAKIILKGLELMEDNAGQTVNFKIYISPCISKANFEVGEEVAEQFPDVVVDRTSYAKPHVDLKGFLMHQLKEVGIKKEQIEVSPRCTMQDERFFSYRRERDKAGRMLGMINLNKT